MKDNRPIYSRQMLRHKEEDRLTAAIPPAGNRPPEILLLLSLTCRQSAFPHSMRAGSPAFSVFS